MRAVLDTNVLVSAVLTAGGPASDLLRAGRDGALEIVTSPKLLAEVAGVLGRERLRRYLSEKDAGEYLRALRQLTKVVRDPDDVRQVCRDPDDDYLVALAEHHRIELLVSGDRDLFDLSAPAVGVRIVTPREALELVRRSETAEP